MPRGARPGERRGGRAPGSANKKTREIANRAAEAGITPLEYMLAVMRDESVERNVRLDAAKSAAPYIHPRLSAIEHTGKDGGPIKTEDISDNERARRILFALETAARSK